MKEETVNEGMREKEMIQQKEELEKEKRNDKQIQTQIKNDKE